MTDPQHQNNPDGNPTFPYWGTQGSTGQPFDPNNFLIQSGTTLIDSATNSYSYVHTSHEYLGGIKVVFTASQPPILGDSVVNGVLVPRPIVPNPARNVFQNGMPKPITNNDPGFQQKKIDRKSVGSWPKDKAWIDDVEDRH